MISIRQNFFETNSSSVHVLVIPKETCLIVPNKVYLTGGDYGWEQNKDFNTIQYFYQACVDRGPEMVKLFIDYLKRKGVEEVNCREINEDSIFCSGYIDHSYNIPLNDLFNNESLLDRFLFSENSFVETGNDNDKYCPDADRYDSDIYDTIEKYN